jgi:hypothetical protein
MSREEMAQNAPKDFIEGNLNLLPSLPIALPAMERSAKNVLCF